LSAKNHENFDANELVEVPFNENEMKLAWPAQIEADGGMIT